MQTLTVLSGSRSSEELKSAGNVETIKSLNSMEADDKVLEVMWECKRIAARVKVAHRREPRGRTGCSSPRQTFLREAAESSRLSASEATQEIPLMEPLQYLVREGKKSLLLEDGFNQSQTSHSLVTVNVTYRSVPF